MSKNEAATPSNVFDVCNILSDSPEAESFPGLKTHKGFPSNIRANSGPKKRSRSAWSRSESLSSCSPSQKRKRPVIAKSSHRAVCSKRTSLNKI